MTMDDCDEGERDEMPIDAVTSLASRAGARAVAAALKNAGEATGVGFDLLYNMARRESALDPNARAATSSAAGLFQFIEQTWLAAVKTYGARHGLAEAASAVTKNADGRHVVADPGKREEILDLRFDPAMAAALAGELINENKAGLEKRLGRAVDAAEIYAAHFLGLAGATKLLSAAPDADAAALLPKAAAANRRVFYAGERAKSVGEVIASIAETMGLAEKTAAPAQQNVASPPLETKSAAAYRLRAPERLAPAAAVPGPARAAPAPPEPFSLQGFGLLRASLPPLALAILQAFDPTRLGAEREEKTPRAP